MIAATSPAYSARTLSGIMSQWCGRTSRLPGRCAMPSVSASTTRAPMLSGGPVSGIAS